jgi:hypothetical protein
MTPEIKERLLEIANEDAEELYEVYGAEGLWVTKDDLPSDPSEFTERDYEKVFSADRIADFQKGLPLTEAERRECPKTRGRLLGQQTAHM